MLGASGRMDALAHLLGHTGGHSLGPRGRHSHSLAAGLGAPVAWLASSAQAKS